MKRVGFLVVIVLVSTAFQCETTPSSIPSEGEVESCLTNKQWYATIIEELKNNPTVKGEVIRYTYHGQTVYYVDTCKGCPDSMALVYTCDGEIICQFGGIAGFNTCPDFKDFASDKKVLWQN